jgi:hypothetical protein
MPINSLDDYVAADKRNYLIVATAAATTVAAIPFAAHQLPGNPGGAGVTLVEQAPVIAVGASGAGAVPTRSTSGMGCLPLQTVAGTPKYYITRVFSGNTVGCRHKLYDRLWHANVATSSLGTVTIASPPSYAARLPGSNYAGLELFLEVTTAIAAATTITITYTNQDGVTGRTAIATPSLTGFTIGRHVYIGLQEDDTGIQAIESIVVGGTAGAGAINVCVVRPLWFGKCSTNSGEIQPFDRTGMPVVFPTSCIQLEVTADSTSSGLPTMFVEVAAL